MHPKILSLWIATLLLAAIGCSNETDSAPRQVGVQTQTLVLTPGWVTGSGWPAETLLALNSVHLRRDSQITGNVVVIRAGSGPFLAGNTEAVVGSGVDLKGDLRADGVKVEDGARVKGAVAYNTLDNRGTIEGARVTPLALPLNVKVPNVPNFNAGTQSVTVASRTLQTRAAGSYRDIVLRSGSADTKTTLRLSGGVYALQSLALDSHSRVECSAACEVRIKGRLTVGTHSYIGPAATSGLQMSAVQFIVEGTNGGNGGPESNPLAAEVDAHSELKAFMFVPNGTLHLKANTNSIGKFIAKDLDAGNDADVRDGTGIVMLPGQWVSGSRWPTEAVTALNSIDFNQGVQVQGDVAVIAAAMGPVLSTGYEASLASNVTITGGLRADSVIGRNKSRVTGALAYNNLTDNGITAGSRVTPLALPLAITTPAFPAFSAGTTVVDVPARNDRSLAAGSYGLIRLRGGSSNDKTVLTLTGGVYNVADIEFGEHSRIECAAACELRVKNRIGPGANSYLGPTNNNPLDLSQVRVFVEGKNGGNGQPGTTPFAAVFGADSAVSAFVFVPNGTLHVRADNQIRGRVVARDIQINDSSRVTAAGTVVTPPQITTQPSSQTVAEGQNATFSVVAVGMALTYQWQRNGANIAGATSSSYTLGPVGLTDSGASFRVIVTNAAGSVTSNVATLTVTHAAPVITAQPSDATVLEGESAGFSVTATGTQLSYQWRKDGAALAGKTSATLALSDVTDASAGNYDVVVTNPGGSVTSRAAVLTVSLRPPVITAQPSDATVREGQSATFRVTATGTQRSYQWRKGGADLAGQTDATLTLDSVSLDDAGNYEVVVSNSGGSVTSRTAVLTVIPAPPVIVTQPSDLTVSERQAAVFSVGATGALLGYQWRKGGVALPGETAETLALSSVSVADGGSYDVVVSNPGGSVTSRSATLTVQLLPPRVTQHPASQTVTERSSVTFQCEASGTAVQYRWHRGGSAIAGATSGTYTIASVAHTDAGDYTCVATNAGGSDTSNPATLTVRLLAPQITDEPEDLTRIEDQTATFSCEASGTLVTYQWQKDEQDIAGATDDSFSIESVAPSDAGAYRCIARNTGGQVESRAATLTVIERVRITVQPSALTVVERESATFTVEATGTDLTYQWQRNGASIGGATDSSYTIDSTSLDDDGVSFRVVVKNLAGSVTSAAAVLTVTHAAPEITAEPSDTAALERQTASFSVTATGSDLRYQWRKDGTELSGRTSATLTLNSVSLADTGSYDVVVTNPGGTVTSRTARLTVNLQPPVIAEQPSDATVIEHRSASFEVRATGTQLTYQWRKGGADLAGETNSTLTFDSVALDDAGNYEVVISNSGGAVTSRTAVLTVIPAVPVIDSEPSDQTVSEGQSATFSVHATGSLLNYQWRKGGTALAGATSATLTLPAVSAADGGDYDVVVGNSGGSVTSRRATLTVNLLAPQVTQHPTSQTVTERSAVTFECEASGTSVQYQWQRDGSAIAGATSASFTIASVSHTDAGSYACVATNSGGTDTSDPATLTVRLDAPQLTEEPADLTRIEDQSATFTCEASGTLVSYRWQKDGQDIAGATEASFAIESVVPGDAGAYRCIATNSGGTAESRAATLTVITRVRIVTQPAAVSVVEGESATFTVAATGTDLTYQWQRNGANIAGATAQSYTLDPAGLDDDGASFRVVVKNVANSVTSAAAVLNVTHAAPVITAQPSDAIAVERETASFSVTATGSDLEYQWRKGGVELPGRTSATLTLSSVTVADGGSYDVVVSNPGGSVTSRTAALTIHLAPPEITAEPSDATVIEHQSVSFQVTATGTAITYQWRKGGVDLPGQTNPTLSLNPVSLDDAGNYEVVVSNTGGSVTSRGAVLTVIPAVPVITAEPSDLTVTERDSATFNVTATGYQLSYQWRKDGANLAGRTSASLTLNDVSVDDAGGYDVVVSTPGGSATSRVATLTVRLLPPRVTQHPASQTITERNAVTFRCAASGTSVAYQWQRDGSAIEGATSDTFTIATVAHTDAGAYACVATNTGGSDTSNAAILTVRLIAPAITVEPEDLTRAEREAATFTCEASGTLVSYRWQKGEQDIASATGTNFTIPSLQRSDAGEYRCVATNTGGDAESRAATLTVNLLPPSVSAGPLPVRVFERETAVFQCLGEGSEIHYRWQKDEIDIPDANDAVLALVGVSHLDAGAYRCVVYNEAGAATSQPATLTVDLLPASFPAHPQSVTVTEGESFSLQCPAVGTLLSIQWAKDATDIDGATSTTYTVEHADLTHTGSYTCTATNSGGAVTSQPASVVVQMRPPVITTQPTDVNVNENQPITLQVVAEGTALTYQWLRSGAPVPGATEATYTKAQATASDDGVQYRVVVSNAGGSVTSGPATVHVADTTAPALEVNGETEIRTTDSSFTLTGSAGDTGSGLRDVTLTTDRVPGQSFGVVLDNAGAFTGQIPLSLGTNVITIVARDARGNETRRTITIIVTAAELPQITIVSPSAGSTVQTDRITVSGSVRSTLPASDIKLLLGSATLYPTGAGPDYAFSFEHVRLVSGPNLITVVAQTPRGTTQADVTVNYGTVQPPPTTPVPPVIELQPDASDVYLATDTIPVTGTVRAQRCVQTIKVNGETTSFIGTGTTVTFSTTRKFSEAGSDDVVVQVSVVDCDGAAAAVSFSAHRDDGAPLIELDGLQLAPVVNAVTRTPYRLSGTIVDRALAGLTIASQSVQAQPTGVPGQWRFAADVGLARQVSETLLIEAWDAAGQRGSREVVLRLETSIALEVLAPIERGAYLVTDQPVAIDVTARALGMAAGDIVTARFDEGSEQVLIRAGSIANGTLNVAPVAGSHTLTVSVKSSEGSMLAQRSVPLTFTDERSLPLRVESQEPAADSVDVEANTPIIVRFNRAIDPAKLTMSVVETAHGKLFQEQPPGADLRELSSVELIDVDREREPVAGTAQNLPGNRLITFYPSQDYAYGGTVFVDLKYDGQELAHSKFTVRPLPTLVHGFVANHLLIPLQGIEVLLPDLNRTATSNDDGNWNFGFGDPAARHIAPGRYRAVFNPNRTNDRFGTVERFVELTAGLGYAGTILLPELNRAEPFRHIVSQQPASASLASGDLELDLHQASLVFPDGQAEGDIHVQFLAGSQVGHVNVDGARPDWVFSVQPAPITVEGPVAIRMQLPKLDESHDYVSRLPEHMLLVGLDPRSLQIAPIGVLKLNREQRSVSSVGVVHLDRLDYIGLASTAASPQVLGQYAAGEIDLTALVAAIGAAP